MLQSRTAEMMRMGLAGPSQVVKVLSASCRRCHSREFTSNSGSRFSDLPRKKALPTNYFNRRYSPPTQSTSSWILDRPSPSTAALAFLPFSLSSIPENLATICLASPLPGGWSIILLTIFLRSAITLPTTIWQRKRIARTRKFVIPEMRSLNAVLARSIAKESRAQGLSYEEYKKRLRSILAGHQSRLHRAHGTHPLPTILVPLGIHIPLLVTLSLTIRRAVESEVEGGWGSQAFMWLDSLGAVDPMGILPIMGGIVAFANAEAVGSKVKSAVPEVPSPEDPAGGSTERGEGEGDKQMILGSSSGARNRLKSPAKQTEIDVSLGSSVKMFPRSIKNKRKLSTSSRVLALPRPRPAYRPTPAASKPSTPAKSNSPDAHLTPIQGTEKADEESRKAEIRTKFISNILRIGAVLFVPIASQVPSALALYWTTSMVYTLIQNLVFNRMDAEEKAKAA